MLSDIELWKVISIVPNYEGSTLGNIKTVVSNSTICTPINCKVGKSSES